LIGLFTNRYKAELNYGVFNRVLPETDNQWKRWRYSSREQLGMNTRSLFVCVPLLLLASLTYGGSYQRTRDGQTLVWRDVPARGDEATWSGKSDKDGFATGRGVLTWYKVDRSIVTGSNILDARRYVIMVNHYSGTMVRGKFKGAVTDVEANGKRSAATSVKEANRESRRQKATRERSPRVRSTPAIEPASTPTSAPIVVEAPERTSVLTTPAPDPAQSSSPTAEDSQTALSRETIADGSKSAPETPEPAPEVNQTEITRAQRTPASAPETTTGLAKQTAAAPEATPEQSPSQISQEEQTPEASQRETRLAKGITETPPEQQGMESDAQSKTAPTPSDADNSLEPRSAPPFDLPKPPRKIDAETVAKLDAVYQSAVKANDAGIMDEILADDFVLITDRGDSLTKADLIKEARGKRTTYEQQEVEEGTQKVRIWRDTAVVTALLRVKGTRDQNPFDYKVWVSETYVRTPTGWRYVFGQPLKPDEK
jgi:ketosteroid isomerase-like protein